MKPTADATPRPTPDRLIFIFLGLFSFAVIFSVTAVQAALFLTLIALLVKNYRERSLPLLPRTARAHPLALPWLVYLSVCLLTALTAYYPAKGFSQLNSDFLKYICLFTLLLAVKAEHLPRLSAIYTLAAFAAAVVGITEVSAAKYLDISPRANAFMNAVRYGEVIVIAFLLALSRIALPSKESFSRERAFYLLAAPLIFSALILSQTRGAYLGAVAGVLAMFYFSPASRKKLAAWCAALLILAGLLISTNPALKARVSAGAIANRGDLADNSPATGVNVRLRLWALGFKMLKAHPVLGVGPDNIKKVFKKFHPEPFPEDGIYGTLNNLYVHQAAERGLLGLGALLLLFGASFKFARDRFRSTGSPYALWALTALPAYFVVNLTEISFQHVHTAFAIFLALAFAAAAGKETV